MLSEAPGISVIVPTLNEAGVTGYEANTWQMFVGPAHMPEAIVTKLNAALVEIMQMPETQRHFVSLGMQPTTSTPQQAQDYLLLVYYPRPVPAGRRRPVAHVAEPVLQPADDCVLARHVSCARPSRVVALGRQTGGHRATGRAPRPRTRAGQAEAFRSG